MKQVIRRIINMATAAMLTASVISNHPVYAEEPAETERSPEITVDDGRSETASVVYVNPIYSDVISPSDIKIPAAPSDISPQAVDETVYTTADAAVSAVKTLFLNRDTKGSLSFNIPKSELPEISELKYVFGALVDRAVAHDGIGNEGDYLLYQYGAYSANYTYYTSDTYYHGTANYELTFYTDASQEEVVTNTVNQILSDLNLEGLHDIEKIRRIYQYVCANYDYDYDNLEVESDFLKYTAYGGISRGKMVCQGYANLLYRLLLEEGVDTRIISGIGGDPTEPGGGGRHAWNIVKLLDDYYNVDSTWDANYDGDVSRYRYFMKNMEEFPRHERGNKAGDYNYDYDSTEFDEQYPTAALSYVPADGVYVSEENISVSSTSPSVITATVTPDNATVKTVSYKIADENIAAVDETGNVTAVSEGNTTATVTSDDGLFIAESYIHSEEQDVPGPGDMHFDLDYIQVPVGTGTNWRNHIVFDNPEESGMTVYVTGYNPEILEVNGDEIFAVGRGSDTLTVENAEGKKAEAIIECWAFATGISAPEGTEITMKIGETKTPVYQLDSYNGDTTDERISWGIEASDESPVEFNFETGEMIGIRPGTIHVYATILNGDSVEYTVVVTDEGGEEEGITDFGFIDFYKLPRNSDVNLWDYMFVYPESARGSEITITSSNEYAISVTGTNGMVHTYDSGEAYINVTANGITRGAYFTVGQYADSIWPMDNKSSIHIKTGETRQLQVTTSPDLSLCKDEVISWRLDWANNNCLAVDEKGNVKGLCYGDAGVYATLTNGDSAYFHVYVSDPLEDIAFKKAVIYLPVGYSTNIDQYFEYTPYNASGSPFEIYVHEDGIVTYDGNGYIYGLKKGSTNVTVTSEGKSSTALFVVGNYAYWIDTDQRDFNLKPGDTCTLEYRLSPEGGDISDESPVWKVDSMYPEGCIEFDGKGNVKAVSPGYAYVNVSIAVGHSVTYYINVLAEPEKISFTKKTYYFPADYSADVDMYLEYEPYNSKGTPITVTSSDSSVVRVEDKRLHTAGRGTAKVTVKTENNKTAEADFVVGNYATGIGFSGQSSFRLRSGEEATLEYSLWPQGGNFSDDEVSWSVIREGTVISFDETTRKVKALEAGTGYVKVKTKSGYELTYNIYVVKEPQKVSLDKDTYYVELNGNGYAYASFEPEEAAAVEPVWVIGDTSIISNSYSYSNSLNFRGIKEGKTTIRAVSPYDDKVYAEAPVIVYIPEEASRIITEAEYTGYKGGNLYIKLGFEPMTSDTNVTVTVDNDVVKNINYFNKRLTFRCEKTGTATVTVKARKGKAEAKFKINVVDEEPPADNYDYGFEYLPENTGFVQNYTNLPEYTFITGKMYAFGIIYRYTGSSGFDPSFNTNIFETSGLFRNLGGGGAGGPDGGSFGTALRALKAGTLEIEIAPHRKVLLKVVDYAETEPEIKADETVDNSVVEAISESESLGLEDAMIDAMSSVSVPDNLEIDENEKIIAQTYLDVNIAACETDSEGNGTLKLNIEPMYKFTAVPADADNASSGRELTAPAPLNITGPVTVSIPVGDYFKESEIRKVLVTHIKDDGTEYFYNGIYKDGVITFENPNGFSEFIITLLTTEEEPVKEIRSAKILSDKFVTPAFGTSFIWPEDMKTAGSGYLTPEEFNKTQQGQGVGDTVGVLNMGTVDNIGMRVTWDDVVFNDKDSYVYRISLYAAKGFVFADDVAGYLNDLKADKVVSRGDYITMYFQFGPFKNDDSIIRLAGADRFDTSIKIAEAFMQEKKIAKLDSVILANGINFADALAGSYLSYVKNAPILITWEGIEGYKPYEQINTFIKKNVKEGGTVYVLGGEEAVKPQTLTGLEKFKINRLAGDNRFETNLKILEETKVSDQDILVATGMNFADSLSASAVNRPILLVWEQLFDMQKDYLKTLKGNDYYILGGELAVTPGVEKQLKAYGKVERLAGSDRHETSVLIAETFCPEAESAVLALSTNFPDGLCGGPLASATKAPLILTHDLVKEPAVKHCKKHNITKGYVLGGDGLVGDDTVTAIFNTDAEIIVK